MSQEVSTLAEVFLQFGGRTMFTLGTACTAMAVIYGVHRITGLGISMFTNLPSWLGMKKSITNGEQDSDVVVTRKQVFDELTYYGRICILIIFGVGIKFIGNWLSLESTTKALNLWLYKQ